MLKYRLIGKETVPMRTERGTFAAGNPGGPGRPPKSVEAEYQAAVRRAVKPAALAAVLRALVTKGRKGDVQAAKLVLAYTVGSPVTRIDQTVTARADGKIGMEHMLAMAQNADEYAKAAGSLPPEAYGPQPTVPDSTTPRA